MNDGEIRELGRIAGLVEAMRDDLDAKHRENQKWQEGHDVTDQRNFQEVFRRLRVIEQRNAVDDKLSAREALAQQEEAAQSSQRQAWLHLLISSQAPIVAAVVGAALTFWLMKG